MPWLTTDLVNGAWSPALSAVVGYLQPIQLDRRILTMAVIGPANSILRIYRGYVLTAAGLISSVFPADDRLYDSTMGDAPILLRAGEAATFAWTAGASASGQVGVVTVTSQWGGG
jgi:hypothetical protein